MSDDSSEPQQSLATKLHQISADDLAALESLLPELMWFRSDLMTSRQRSQWRRVMAVMQNVRWNYGPPSECYRIQADETEPPTDPEPTPFT